MSTIERYYTCTTDGHNKDYLLAIDKDRLVATAIWGPIGGTKTTDTYKVSDLEELDALFAEKNRRRIKHGYTIEWTMESLDSDSASTEFESDLKELVAAERLAV